MRDSSNSAEVGGGAEALSTHSERASSVDYASVPALSVAIPAAARRVSIPLGGWPKRLFDICFAAAALALIGPVLLVIALAIKLDTPGPALFRQERGGLNGRTFKIWKFRTMMVSDDDGPLRQAERDDGRTSALGRLLRRSSVDEFPQLVNVLLGEMSLVGPRPHALAHDLQFAAIDARYHQRFVARPGLTGLAQISGCRGPTHTTEAVRARLAHDLAYIERWSLLGDLRIIFQTIAMMWRDPLAF